MKNKIEYNNVSNVEIIMEKKTRSFDKIDLILILIYCCEIPSIF